jgi:hypothetical protein
LAVWQRTHAKTRSDGDDERHQKGHADDEDDPDPSQQQSQFGIHGGCFDGATAPLLHRSGAIFPFVFSAGGPG